MFTDDRVGPRHLSTGKCLCQFIEEHFKNTNNYQKQQPANGFNEQAPQVTTLTSHHLPPNTELKSNQETLINSQKIYNQQSIVPTLSRLVSLNDNRPEHLKIDMKTVGQQHVIPINQPDGLLINFWRSQEQQQLAISNEKHLVANLNLTPSIQTFANSSPLNSPDVSLEIGSDSIGRSDDLVRKLRLLLELRKNELQGLDGSLFSNILYKTPQPFPALNQMDNKTQVSSRDVTARTKGEITSIKENNLVKVNAGKKFYNQREGLFFFGTNGTKKSQHNGTNRDHVLEIC